MKTIEAVKNQVKLVPPTPGVYMFKNAQKKVIYVGKAKVLPNRLSSYFSTRLEPKTHAMVNAAANISYIPVDSEFEALLLEAKLVKKYMPQYNIELRDDKSPLYIGITKEPLPRVITLRQRELNNYKLRTYFGPFINGSAPKLVLKLTRRVFHYATHKPTKRSCVYSQIGLCDPCPSEVVKDVRLKAEYMKNIRGVVGILSGRFKFIRKQLESEMKQYSREENFEKAEEVKQKLDALDYITAYRPSESNYIQNPNLLTDIRERELKNLTNIIAKYYPELFSPKEVIKRIECYDVAHLAGSFPTASMVTFINGEPDKTLYRHYKVSDKKRNNDVGSMKSVLSKRKARFTDWGKPDLIIVDGGKGQVTAAREVFGDGIALVGLAKKYETLVFEKNGKFLEIRLPDGPAKALVQRLRNEAHRFARRYHHKLVANAIKSVVK